MGSNSLREWITVYLKGLAMGAAGAVPGVSGGTIALITGIYQRLITSLTSVNKKNAWKFLQSFQVLDLSSLKKQFLEMDLLFLTVLGLGIVTAVITVSNLVAYLLTYYPIPTFGFFFGLILVSAVILSKNVDISSGKTRFAALSGFLTAFLVSGYATTALGSSLPVVFFAGMFAISAQILPGISGSLVLMILGQYDYMAEALSKFTDSVLSFFINGSSKGLLETAPPVVTFVSGAVIGLFTVAHAVRWSLENHRQVTVAFLVSLIFGALRAPVEETRQIVLDQGLTWLQVLPEFTVLALVGGLSIFVLDYYTGMIEY